MFNTNVKNYNLQIASALYTTALASVIREAVTNKEYHFDITIMADSEKEGRQKLWDALEGRNIISPTCKVKRVKKWVVKVR